MIFCKHLFVVTGMWLGKRTGGAYHVAGDLLMLLGDGVIGSTQAVLVHIWRHAKKTVEVVNSDALASHGHLKDIVSNAIGRHFGRNF